MPAIVSNMSESTISTVPLSDDSSQKFRRQERNIQDSDSNDIIFNQNKNVFIDEAEALSQEEPSQLELSHQKLITSNALRPPSHVLKTRRLSKMSATNTVNDAATDRESHSLRYTPLTTEKPSMYSKDNSSSKRKASFVHGNNFNSTDLYHQSAVSPRFMAFRKLSEVTDLPLHPTLPFLNVQSSAYHYQYQHQTSVPEERDLSALMDNMQQQLIEKIDDLIETKLKFHFDKFRAELIKTRVETVPNTKWEELKDEVSSITTKLKQGLLKLPEEKLDQCATQKNTSVTTASVDGSSYLNTANCLDSDSTEICLSDSRDSSLSYGNKIDTSWADIMQIEDEIRNGASRKPKRNCEERSEIAKNDTSLRVCERHAANVSTTTLSRGTSPNGMGLYAADTWKQRKQQRLAKPKRSLVRHDPVKNQKDVDGCNHQNNTLSEITTNSSTVRYSDSPRKHYPANSRPNTGKHCKSTSNDTEGPSAKYYTENGYLIFTTVVNGQPSTYTVKIP